MGVVERINTNFKLCAPTSTQQQDFCNLLCQAAQNLARLIHAASMDCREKSIALTKLEESVFWAQAAVLRSTAHSENEKESGVLDKHE
jgi:hypothetical protein